MNYAEKDLMLRSEYLDKRLKYAARVILELEEKVKDLQVQLVEQSCRIKKLETRG